MADFDGVILDMESGELFSGGGRDDGALDAEVCEAVYREEIAEIARLREYLKLERPGGRGMTRADRLKGLAILAERERVAESEYQGVPVEKIEPEPIIKLLTTREQAKRQGLRRYRTGKPCKYGHMSERITQNSSCVACIRDCRPLPSGLAYHRF